MLLAPLTPSVLTIFLLQPFWGGVFPVSYTVRIQMSVITLRENCNTYGSLCPESFLNQMLPLELLVKNYYCHKREQPRTSNTEPSFLLQECSKAVSSCQQISRLCFAHKNALSTKVSSFSPCTTASSNLSLSIPSYEQLLHYLKGTEHFLLSHFTH